MKLEKKHWTPIEVAYPEADKEVLLVFLEPFFGTYTQEIETGYYSDIEKRFFFSLTRKEVVGPGVTHWMELPELPKKEI